MRLMLEGKINRIYVQSLCMMFFHGVKFPENEENPDGTVYVKAEEQDGGVLAECLFSYFDKSAKASAFCAFDDESTSERTSKCAVGKAVYLAGKELTRKEIPWGILTGIRPSKVGAELLLKHGYEKAYDILINKYLVSPKKAELTLAVAKNETKILSEYDESTCSLYVSIPFCPTRCEYCSFISYATPKLFEQIPSYLEKLCRELENKAEIIKKLGKKLVTIYIGGGTPTTLEPCQLEKLLSTIENSFDLTHLEEFTVEAGRPDTITKEKLDLLKKHGVMRVSVNPQSLNDEVLLAIGRRHTVDDFFRAYEIVEKEEFSSVNTDLIVGLSLDTYESFVKTIDKICDLSPENVTVHAFSVKKSARILENDNEIYSKQDASAILSSDYAYNKLISFGYEPYYMYRQKNTVCDLENVGYTKIGKECKYNVLMMGDSHTVFSAGAGATTKLVRKIDGKEEIHRIFSPKYPYEYLQDNQDTEKEILSFFE